MLSEAIIAGIRFQRDSKFGLNQARRVMVTGEVAPSDWL